MNIIWFKDINKDKVNLVGGKGANLGEMFNKFPIPDGFCVTTNAYQSFITNNNLFEKIMQKLEKIDYENTDHLDSVSKEIEELMLNGDMPEDLSREIVDSYNKLNGFVAVRSSATAEDLEGASFAGQQATFLNVKGEEELLLSVKKCWASLFTSRAIYYRFTKKFEHKDVLISVVVQKMIQSKVSGVMFTANPINNSKDEIVIEGSYGLGEMIVSGMVTPDTFMLKKEPLSIYNKHIGEKNRMMIKQGKENKIIDVPDSIKNRQSISDKNILKLAEIGVGIEEHYKKPMDIEWAMDKNSEIFILQARPITTLN